MSELPAPQPPTPPLPGRGGWLRLHPATPLLKGGIALIAVIGFLLANLRERLIELFVGGPDGGDLVEELYRHGHLGWALAIVLGGIALGVLGFYLSWRMHTYRINDEAVEVRSGILFRTHRKARLDRIQGIAITRPFIARLFGAARLELSVAGQDAKVQLAYLRGSDVDRLRHDILLLASARRAEEMTSEPGTPGQPGASSPGSVLDAGGAGTVIGRRVSELLAPELDPQAAPPESVVRISPLRLAGSLLASGATVWLLVGSIVLVVVASTGRELGFVFLLVPAFIGGVGYYVRQVTRSLRFSIASTPDGIRVGYGLLTTSNDTLPPGRIHAVEVLQPLLWRPFGWWTIRVNRAGHASSGSGSQPATTMLPVGTRADVEKVLLLLLPGLASEETRHLILAGMESRSAGRAAARGSGAGRVAARGGGAGRVAARGGGAGRVAARGTSRRIEATPDGLDTAAGGLLDQRGGVDAGGLLDQRGGVDAGGLLDQRGGAGRVAARGTSRRIETTSDGLRSAEGIQFVPAPRRGRWLRPFSWRRTGYALTPDAVLLRKGLVWRHLVVVPAARIQSLRLEQGPIERALDLTSLALDTVAGPVSPRLSILDRALAISAFGAVTAAASAAGAAEDRGHEPRVTPTEAEE